jgi:probable FeS assembly SUF system protein SufT
MNMSTPEIVKLNRDCIAIQVPFGNQITLCKDAEVIITQALGGTYTVISNGNMYRIENKNADALGKAVLTFLPADDTNLTLKDKIWAVLRSCYDPEIPVNIVDLGLIYGVDITPTVAQNKYQVVIRMTLTAPGCGMGPIIAAEAEHKVASLPEVESVKMEIVFDPPWNRNMMSDQAKLALGVM